MRFRFVLQLDRLYDDDPDGLEPREICTDEVSVQAERAAEPRLVALFAELKAQFAERINALQPSRTRSRGRTHEPPSPL